MFKTFSRSTLILLLLLSPTSWSAEKTSPAKINAKMSAFIKQLMNKMTIDEKIGQLVQYTSDMAVTGVSLRANYQAEIAKGRVGSLFNAFTPKVTREFQQLAIEKSRLKIPLLFAYDAVHGHRTVFPIPLGESASWDLILMQSTAQASAREASADGLHWTFAPMVDISREPRWGRIMEGAGEDTWLGAKIAAARVKGFQGSEIGALDHVLACVKHFATYGAPTAGREYNTTDLSERELRETYLPPYKAAIDAGAATIMTSINAVNGQPSASNHQLLTDILRKQWKFNGFVVTDYTSINELVPHGVAVDNKDAARLALTAGVDMDMEGGLFNQHLKVLLREKKVTLAQIEAATRRILEAKYKLGLFTDPYRFSDEKRAKDEIMKPENLALARESARHSIVLLKNNNAVLPLKRGQSVALIGPLADDKSNQLGSWSGAGDWKKAVSLREGLLNVVGDKLKLSYSLGANLLEDDSLINFLNAHGALIKKDKRTQAELLKEAVSAARKADVVVLALGEASSMSGEASSRTRIRVPENQQDLLRALKGVGKPIVLVLYNGRPLALEGENYTADAMVEAWFLGHQAGNAIADVLYGDYNPSGRLTVTFPRNEGQIPIYYSQMSTGRPHAPVEQFGFKDSRFKYSSRYIDSPNDPLFPFGFGLSYTTFEYSDVKLGQDKIKMGGTLPVQITVRNSGMVAGEETVQLYVRDLVGSVTRPVKLLRAFAKVLLKPGESRDVEFTLTTEDLKFYDQKMKWVAEKGEFSVMVGRNSSDVKEARFFLE